jgi:hypothetical protein
LQQLNDVDYKIPLFGQSAVEAIDEIERLMNGATIIELTDSVKLRAAQRAIEKKPHFTEARTRSATPSS